MRACESDVLLLQLLGDHRPGEWEQLDQLYKSPTNLWIQDIQARVLDALNMTVAATCGSKFNATDVRLSHFGFIK